MERLHCCIVLLITGLGLTFNLTAVAEIKVDINNTGRWWYNSTEAGFTPWNTNYTWFSGGGHDLSHL